MTRPRTITELATNAGTYNWLCQDFGPEMVARLLDLEREMLALLERELPEADGYEATLLAHAIAADGAWFAAIAQERLGEVAKALAKAHQAARDLLKALDELPPAAIFGLHMRLLALDFPPALRRQALHRELVYRTVGKIAAGLNSRKAGVAEIARAAAETREGAPLLQDMQGGATGGARKKGSKHRPAWLARCVGDAFERAGAPVTISGTGEGAYPRVVAAVLEAAGLRDASAVDAARREAERRRAALHGHAALRSGETARKARKISTGPAGGM
jgi:hypothetical protein